MPFLGKTGGSPQDSIRLRQMRGARRLCQKPARRDPLLLSLPFLPCAPQEYCYCSFSVRKTDSAYDKIAPQPFTCVHFHRRRV